VETLVETFFTGGAFLMIFFFAAATGLFLMTFFFAAATGFLFPAALVVPNVGFAA
jgi:hypothetical protein